EQPIATRAPVLLTPTETTPEAQLPFAGREEEISTLVELWRRACKGAGSVAFISGETGIGKSRLASEVFRHLKRLRGQAFTGGTSHPENQPLQSILAIFRQLVPLLGQTDIADTDLAALLPVLPELGNVRRGTVRQNVDRDNDGDGLFEAFSASLRA